MKKISVFICLCMFVFILCACGDDLNNRYPDQYRWVDSFDCGDIPELVDPDYIEKSLEEGIFLVSTPEELASFNYIVNTTLYNQDLTMQLQNDIDLAGYEWAPMGWSIADIEAIDISFEGTVDGNGYTIRNMTIKDDKCSGSVGFIGWGVRCTVQNITFENASVSGDVHVGIIAGQAIGCRFENCHANGEVEGSDSGSMIGYDASSKIIDCTADVIVNGKIFDFLSWNEKEKSEIVVEHLVEITIDDNHMVWRPENEEYESVSWVIKKDGIVVLQRCADNEMSYCYTDNTPGVYEIYLESYIEGQYMPISNTVKYIIE